MKRVYINIGKVAVTTLLLLLVYHRAQAHNLAFDLRHLAGLPLVFFAMILCANTCLSVRKWQILLAADGVTPPFSQLLARYLIGTFFNLFLPSSIGGDVYRVASFGQGQIVKTAAAVFAERLSGFIAMTSICAVFSVLSYRYLSGPAFIIVPFACTAVLIGIALALMRPAVIRRLMALARVDRISKVKQLFDLLLLSFGAYVRQRWLLVRIMGISYAFQLLVIVAIYCLSLAIHLDVSPFLFLFFVPLIGIMESIPISIFGLGLRDAGYVMFLTSAGVPDAQTEAGAMSLLYVALTVVYALLGGVLLLKRLYFGAEDPVAKPSTEPDYQQTVIPGMRSKPLRIGMIFGRVADRDGATLYTHPLIAAILAADPINHYVLFWPEARFAGTYQNHPNVTEVIVPGGESPTGPMGRLMWNQIKIPWLLARHKVDMVYNSSPSVPLWFSGRAVCSVQGLERFAARQLFSGFARFFYTAAMRCHCARADFILVATQIGKRDLQKYLGVAAKKIQVIPESYNEACQRINDATELNRVKSKLKLPPAFILFVGGTTALENVSALLRAFAQMRRNGSRHKLVLAGFNRWTNNTLPNLIDQLGLANDILLLGLVEDDDRAALYSLADCLAVPSFYEAFGSVALEAQACGCPVVVSNRGAVQEVVGDKAALLLNPEDPAGLAGQLQRVLSDTAVRNELIRRGFDNVRKYSWSAMARQIVQVFESLA